MSVLRDLRLATYHESVEPYAYADGETLVVRLRVPSLVDSVTVTHYDKFKREATSEDISAQLYAYEDEELVQFQAQLARVSKRFRYFFRIHTTEETFFYSRNGVSREEPSDADAFEVPYLGERDHFSPPEWTKGAVYYQIFPERFYRSGTVPNDHTLSDWDATPTADAFFGGDLPGILAKLDHLTALGVDVLYMTPVFHAPSNHKYDTVDYFHIDPHFGSTEDLKRLVDACHDRGIRVVLDAVFNHMGAQHPVFQDLLEKGADSPYASQIIARNWPLSPEALNYETFGYVANMPKWRTAHPAVEQMLCNVGTHWMRETGVDGFRLDVSDEVEHTFWKIFRRAIKAENPDALICGEIWQVATPWLRGDEFDAVMNYPLGRAILDYVATATIHAGEFLYRVEKIRSLYPEHVLKTLWCLLDSHDTARLLTLCDGDTARAKLASFIQFTMFGAPLLYYGDEVGMTGENDPLCRGGMVWEHVRQNLSLFEHYQTLIALRKQFRALRDGAYRPLLSRDNLNVCAYLRRCEQSAEQLVALVNSTANEQVITVTDALIGDVMYTRVTGDGPETLSKGKSLSIPPYTALLYAKTGRDPYGR